MIRAGARHVLIWTAPAANLAGPRYNLLTYRLHATAPAPVCKKSSAPSDCTNDGLLLQPIAESDAPALRNE